jgi:hypothetical protein
MKANIFVPKKINVGFVNRQDTYTNKLAYIIYFDEKNVLRKEISWNNWRDKKIDSIIYNNEPLSGFVLNKKAGGYSTGWNHRQTYCRVYDPRGFEFEITIHNLLYILENANSIKGKGLDGNFIYGWEGKELILLPIDAPDYKEIKKYTDIILENKTIKPKDLILGATYLTKDDKEYIYMGKYTYWERGFSSGEIKNKGKQFYFIPKLENYTNYDSWYTLYRTTLGKKFIKCVNEKCIENFAFLFDIIENSSHYSPYDKTKDEYNFYTFEEFRKSVEKNMYLKKYWREKDKKCFTLDKVWEGCYKYCYKLRHEYNNNVIHRSENYYKYDLEELYNKLKPMYKIEYLKNGKRLSYEK